MTVRHARRYVSTNPEPEMRECPHPTCKNMIPRNMFACRHHWFALPEDLRREITLKWEIYRAALRSKDLIRVGEAAQELHNAQSQADPFWRVGT
jgi:hypothetical protein